MAHAHIERTLAGYFRLLAFPLAVSQVIIHRSPECCTQLGDGLPFVVDQCADEQQLAEQAIILCNKWVRLL